MIEVEKMESPQWRMSQDELFNKIIKNVKLANLDKLSSTDKYVFYEECKANIEPELKDKLKILNGQKKSMQEMYDILNQFFKNSTIYQINIDDNYIGCIEHIGRNSWRCYKILGYQLHVGI